MPPARKRIETPLKICTFGVTVSQTRNERPPINPRLTEIPIAISRGFRNRPPLCPVSLHSYALLDHPAPALLTSTPSCGAYSSTLEIETQTQRRSSPTLVASRGTPLRTRRCMHYNYIVPSCSTQQKENVVSKYLPCDYLNQSLARHALLVDYQSCATCGKTEPISVHDLLLCPMAC